MKTLKTLFLITTVGIWGPFWLIHRFSTIFAALLFVTLISGCASNSARMDESPCACNFTPANELTHENPNA